MVFHKSLECLLVFCGFAEKGPTKHGPRSPCGIPCVTELGERGALPQEILLIFIFLFLHLCLF